jgi:TRAP-type C4-dicarboxylate transport system permease small subunit
MSGHGLDAESAGTTSTNPFFAALARALDALNAAIVRLAHIVLVLASLVLSYSVTIRFLFKSPTYWQDEAAVYLLVGATFLSAAYIQSVRGHIGIEVLSGLLPPTIDRARRILVDIMSFAFCAFFSWKSWTLFHEAWVEGTVSSSTWAPPLWIPYAVMATGMTLLAAQILLQVLVATNGARSGGRRS